MNKEQTNIFKIYKQKIVFFLSFLERKETKMRKRMNERKALEDKTPRTVT